MSINISALELSGGRYTFRVAPVVVDSNNWSWKNTVSTLPVELLSGAPTSDYVRIQITYAHIRPDIFGCVAMLRAARVVTLASCSEVWRRWLLAFAMVLSSSLCVRQCVRACGYVFFCALNYNSNIGTLGNVGIHYGKQYIEK